MTCSWNDLFNFLLLLNHLFPFYFLSLFLSRLSLLFYFFGSCRMKKSMCILLMIIISEISRVGSDPPPKKHCVCVPQDIFSKMPKTKLGECIFHIHNVGYLNFIRFCHFNLQYKTLDKIYHVCLHKYIPPCCVYKMSHGRRNGRRLYYT